MNTKHKNTVQKVINCSLIISLFLITLGLNANSKKENLGSQELERVLEDTSLYCEKLKTMVFHCFCIEKIVETIEQSLHYPRGKKNLRRLSHFLKRRYSVRPPSNPPKKKHEYISQYQVIKIGDKFRENRFLLKHNGKEVLKENARVETTIYSPYGSLSPLLIFAKHQQEKFKYKILKKEKTMSCKAYIVEIKLKARTVQKEPFAIAWIDVKDFSVLKLKVFPQALKGYKYLVFRSDDKNIDKINISDVHYFGYQRNNVRFPSKTEISLSYTGDTHDNSGKQNVYSLGLEKLTKIKTIFTYDKYQFFKVTVDEPVFKDLKKKVRHQLDKREGL
jgi:hypothetical protein